MDSSVIHFFAEQDEENSERSTSWGNNAEQMG